MSENSEFEMLEDRGSALRRIHRIISRGLKVSVTFAERFQQNGFPSDNIRKGFFMYTRALGLVMRAHHEGEDEVIFPYLIEKKVPADYDLLVMEHRAFEDYLHELETYLEDAEKEEKTADLTRVRESLEQIAAMWPMHIVREEEELLGNAIGILSPLEEVNITLAASRHAQRRSDQVHLMIPFQLYNLFPEDRRSFARNIPSRVLEQLDTTWKGKWELMKPFLMD